MAKTKYRYAITLKYTDSNGVVVDKKFDPATTVWFEFMAQGSIFYVQTLLSPQKIIEKEDIATFEQFYIPTKDILALSVIKTVGLTEADKTDILRDVFGVEPKVVVQPAPIKVDTVVTPPVTTETPAPTTDTPAPETEAKA